MNLEGTVYKSTGSWYLLKNKEGVFLKARLKGKLKIDDTITSTNPIAVGDHVVYDIELSEEGELAIIKEVLTRRNYIVRVAPQNRHKKHILAANLDQAIIMATLKQPRTSTGFIDRFLITAEAYHIPAIVLINKVDLLGAEDETTLQAYQSMYAAAGYPVVLISATAQQLPESFLKSLHKKVTLVCGHSGVGKSTLLNELIPDKHLKTEIISAHSGKGQHTTTFAEMYDLPFSGQVIDTPGVKEMGIIDMDPRELSHYYPEMRPYLPYCKFHNCTHIDEPKCAVKQAVELGQLNEQRYDNYCHIFESLKS